jgi:DNA polymerase-3 subunit epsilon
MILLGFDMETTGLDIQNDRPIEIGAILYTTGQKKCLESTGFLVKSDVPVSPFITGLTGITQSALTTFGYDSKDALETVIDMMEQADAVVGQNVIRFDKRMLGSWASRHGLILPEKLWIDSRTDLPGVESKTLTYMAADHGFLNLFPHSALSDVQTCLKIVTMYDIDVVVARAKEPTVVLKAHVGFENNGLAKTRKYGWYDDKKGTKFWYKVVKQSDVKLETSHNEFDVSFVEDVPVEKLWHS